MHHRFVAFVCAPLVFASALCGQGVERLWATNCANCHGERGQGGGAGTQTLLTKELMGQELDRRFFDAIRNGVELHGMPAFGETLADRQSWALVNHIRALQHDDYRKKGGKPKETDGVFSSERAAYKIETVATGLDTPWSVDFLPSGEMLITERPGSLRIFNDGKLSKAVNGLERVYAQGQGGMMDVAVHPDYAKNGWIFLSYSVPGERRGSNSTKLVRGKLKATGEDWAWVEQHPIFDTKPEHFVPSTVHFGCRIVFDPKDPGLLYFCIGERGQGNKAQDVKLPNGKVYRVKSDGSVPADNPFVG